MRTLIVDDEAFVLKVLARSLDRHGIRDVVGCERAQDALDMLASGRLDFELIFVDLQMPEIDGIELLRHLGRAGFRGAVVLVSGTDGRILDTAVKLARRHELDVLGALKKPVSPDDLAEVLSARGPCSRSGRRSTSRAYGPEELKAAIDKGEIVNFYQPQVELHRGAPVAVESLARWQHPDDGLVFPDQFIPTAEQHGLIEALTRAVLASALEESARWGARDLHLGLAVNVSMDNLTSLDLPDLVVAEAARWGFPPERLVLEVTESRLMQDPRAPLDVLTRLRLKGVGISIDDFGTGYSSLAQLRDFPFDELKIDRGFVHGAARDSSLRSIFEASRGLARELGMRIVAEGVEDADDWQFLLDAGCDIAQGYFIARPMPGDDLPGWIRDWESRRPKLAPGGARWLASAS